MSILSDPCCIGAIAVLGIYLVVKLASWVVAAYRRGADESLVQQDRK